MQGTGTQVFSSRLFDNGKGGLDTFLPEEVMKALDVKEGDAVRFLLKDGHVFLVKAPASEVPSTT